MGERILVINDTQEILELFRDILEEEGYEVILYSFAITDMSEIERIRPDLIIADYLFGAERTGWQMIQKLKMRRATAGIPLVICTAATLQVREIEGYLQAQGIALVPKPFDIDDLLGAVRRGLQAPGHAAKLTQARDEAGEQDGEHGGADGAEGKKSKSGAKRDASPER